MELSVYLQGQRSREVIFIATCAARRNAKSIMEEMTVKVKSRDEGPLMSARISSMSVHASGIGRLIL